MSKSDSKFNAVIAKSKAVYGSRIKSAEYDSFMQKSTVPQLVAALKDTGRYKQVLSSVNELQAHRGQIEFLISKAVFETYMRLCSFIPIDLSGFNSFWIKKIELDTIVNTIMFIYSEQWDKIITDIPSYLNPYVSYDLFELGNAKSFDDLIKAVEGSRYYKLLKNVLPNSSFRSGEKIDFEEISTALYADYYKWLFKCIDSEFDGNLKNELREAVFRQVNMENILLAYRMKAYFDRPADEIERLLIPFHKGRSGEIIRETLTDSSAADKILSVFEKHFSKGTAYDKDFLEIAIRRDSYAYFRKRMRTSASGTMVMYSLVNLLDIERQNVTTIIEGVRYSVPPAEMQKLLVI